MRSRRPARICLGVNIDHVATLREVRKASYPDILEAAEAVRRGGADQITVHLREDRRHIQDDDVLRLLRWKKLPVNLEMALTAEMESLSLRYRPESVTLVPERRAEMTTEQGLDLRRNEVRLKKFVKKAHSKKIKVYGFIDPELYSILAAGRLGLDGVEFHTGPFSHAFLGGRKSRAFKKETKRLEEAAAFAWTLGLEVKAGHGLTLENLADLKGLWSLSEVNIGHSIVSRSVFVGLTQAVLEMKRALRPLEKGLLSPREK